jgi:hypothetical protein
MFKPGGVATFDKLLGKLMHPDLSSRIFTPRKPQASHKSKYSKIKN